MAIYADIIKAKHLEEALAWPIPIKHNQIISGVIDTKKKTLTFVTSQLKVGTIKLKDIDNPHAPCRPKFSAFKIGDHGHTLCFGKFEAASDWALWQAGIIK